MTAVYARTHVDIREVVADDVLFVRRTWRETFHNAPGKRRMPWAAFKATFGVAIDRLLEDPDLWILGAYDAGARLRGWIAWTPGRVPTVHYVWVRRESQRQGLASRLIAESGLGPRWVYTHRGVKLPGGTSADVAVAAALAKRGVTAVYVPARTYLG
jgi:GNAT superfamily N-acetyltransferase